MVGTPAALCRRPGGVSLMPTIFREVAQFATEEASLIATVTL